MKLSNKDYIIIWMVISLVLWIILFDNKTRDNNTKIDSLIEENILLEEKVIKKSDIEMLEFFASESKMFADKHIKDIEDTKIYLKELEELYEIETLQLRCYTTQMNRKISWLEYNIYYCAEDDNLEQFRTKKY